MFNTNAIHNVLNIVIAVSGLLTAILLWTGCTQLPTGGVECSQSFLNPTWLAVLTGVSGVLKSVINIFRDGVDNLFKPQPPVQ